MCWHHGSKPYQYSSRAEAPFSRHPWYSPSVYFHHRYWHLLGPHGCPTAHHLPGTGSHRMDHHGLRGHRGWPRVCWICHGVPSLWLLLLVSGDILWTRHWLSAFVGLLLHQQTGHWCNQKPAGSDVSFYITVKSHSHGVPIHLPFSYLYNSLFQQRKHIGLSKGNPPVPIVWKECAYLYVNMIPENDGSNNHICVPSIFNSSRFVLRNDASHVITVTS